MSSFFFLLFMLFFLLFGGGPLGYWWEPLGSPVARVLVQGGPRMLQGGPRILQGGPKNVAGGATMLNAESLPAMELVTRGGPRGSGPPPAKILAPPAALRLKKIKFCKCLYIKYLTSVYPLMLSELNSFTFRNASSMKSASRMLVQGKSFDFPPPWSRAP